MKRSFHRSKCRLKCVYKKSAHRTTVIENKYLFNFSVTTRVMPELAPKG